MSTILAPPIGPPMIDGHAADVEQRAGRQRGRLARRAGLPAGDDRLAAGDERHVPEVGDHGPVRAQRALGPPGGARRVEHRHRVVAVRAARSASSSSGAPVDQLVERHVAAVGPHADELRRPSGRPSADDRVRRRSSSTNSDRHAGVPQRVGELAARPPRVQRHDDGAGRAPRPRTTRRTRAGCAWRWRPGRRARTPNVDCSSRARLRDRRRTSRERQPLVVVDDVDERLVRGAHARTRRRSCAARGRSRAAGRRRAPPPRPRRARRAR